MPFVIILELLCLKTPSDIDTDVTTQIAVFYDKFGAILTQKTTKAVRSKNLLVLQLEVIQLGGLPVPMNFNSEA